LKTVIFLELLKIIEYINVTVVIAFDLSLD